MSLIAALLIVSAQAGAQPAPATQSPARAVLDAFRAVCDKVTDWNQLTQAATAGGWTRVEESSNPQLARINQVARTAIGSDGRLIDSSFRRDVAGRSLHLVVSRWEGDGGKWGNGCRVYDLTAARPIAPLELVTWMGRVPTGNQTFGALGSNLTWEPGWREGLTVSVNHVPATSAFRERYGVSGNVLVAQALGGF
ncbi:MAG TPA: hypothetical protein VGB54_14355 [Allosphingosinicella sp.]|jgi:hypothetical protein